MVQRTAKGDTDYTQLNLHSKYGRLVGIASSEVGCSVPEAAKIISGIKS
jgi:hypothetical protein